MTRMKTTVELDEKKLEAVMRQGGFKTRKEAIDYALTEAERRTRLMALEAKPFYVTDGAVVDPAYDLKKMRARERPHHGRSH